MLDLIFQNRVYDLGMIYDWGNFYSLIMSLVQQGNSNFASVYDKFKDNAIASMETVVGEYFKNAGNL